MYKVVSHTTEAAIIVLRCKPNLRRLSASQNRVMLKHCIYASNWIIALLGNISSPLVTRYWMSSSRYGTNIVTTGHMVLDVF